LVTAGRLTFLFSKFFSSFSFLAKTDFIFQSRLRCLGLGLIFVFHGFFAKCFKIFFAMLSRARAKGHFLSYPQISLVNYQRIWSFQIYRQLAKNLWFFVHFKPACLLSMLVYNCAWLWLNFERWCDVIRVENIWWWNQLDDYGACLLTNFVPQLFLSSKINSFSHIKNWGI